MNKLTDWKGTGRFSSWLDRVHLQMWTHGALQYVYILSSILFSILSNSRVWDNSVYSRTNTFLLLGGAAAGGKCFDFGTNIPFFRSVNLGISHGQAG